MTDLRTLLHEASATTAPTPPPPCVVDADLARGQRALRRRTALRGARGGLLAAAAAGLIAVTAQGGLLPDTQPGPTATPSATRSLPATALVAYTGAQAVGFTLEKVPAGWEVQGVDAGVLTLAPSGMADQDIHSFEGKIAISQVASLPDGLPGTEVSVDGNRSLVFQLLGGEDGSPGARTLFVPQPSGAYLAVQDWAGLGWSDQQLAEFAAGVHATEDTVTTVG